MRSLHSPLQCTSFRPPRRSGDSHPKLRRFYSPAYGAEQYLAYARDVLKTPCVLLVQVRAPTLTLT